MDSEIQNKLYCYVKAFIGYINIFDIPRLTREISCDVKHIREKYDEILDYY